MNTQQLKTYETQPSPKREVHSDTGLPKKDRNISNKPPTPKSTRTRGTRTNKAHGEQKKRNIQDQGRDKKYRD